MARPRTAPNPRKAITFKRAWDYIASTAPSGTLFRRDRVYLQVAAELYVVLCTEGAAKMHPARLARLEMMLAKLGLSPADASRVSARPTEPTGSDFDD